MSSLQRGAKHTKALIQALRRPSQARCFKAAPAAVERGQFISKDTQSLLSSPGQRWTSAASFVPRASSQVPGFDLHSYGALSFSSAATPQVDGKDPSSATSSTTAQPAADETEDPVQRADGGEPKGGTQEMGGTGSGGAQDVASEEVTKEDLVGLLGEKLALLEEKNKEAKALKEKLLWSMAEMENVRHRTKRDAESTRNFAIQTFGKELLEVADNLSRVTSAVPKEIMKANPDDDSSGNVKVLQTLLQGVEMTEKQLQKVFNKNGLERYESLDEQFDPNRHSAVFEMQDPTKTAGAVAMVLKDGYILNGRVIRPAEVAVVKQE